MRQGGEAYGKARLTVDNGAMGPPPPPRGERRGLVVVRERGNCFVLSHKSECEDLGELREVRHVPGRWRGPSDPDIVATVRSPTSPRDSRCDSSIV